MRRALAIVAVIAVLVLGAGALSAVVELPGERRLKEALGFDYVVWAPSGLCLEVPGEGGEGAWRVEAPLPTLRDEARAVAVGDSVYLVGGIGSIEGPAGRSVATFERFDVAAGTYERLPDLPVPLNHVGIAAHGGDVFVIGGQGEEAGRVMATNRAFRYRVAARRWGELPPMSDRRGGHALAVVGDRIYVIGGRADRTFNAGQPNVALVESFDTRSGTWSRHESMPEARDHLGAVAVGGTIYVFGGRLADGTPVARLDSFDPSSGAWSRLPDGPEPTSGIAVLATRGLLWAAGGEQPRAGQVLSGAWGFLLDEQRWIHLPNLPEPLHGYAAVSRGERVYVFGGSTCPGFSPVRTVSSLALPER